MHNMSRTTEQLYPQKWKKTMRVQTNVLEQTCKQSMSGTFIFFFKLLSLVASTTVSHHER